MTFCSHGREPVVKLQGCFESQRDGIHLAGWMRIANNFPLMKSLVINQLNSDVISFEHIDSSRFFNEISQAIVE